MATTTYKAPRAYTAPKYQSVKYDEKKYSKGIDTSYYTNAVNAYNKQAEKDRANQLGEAQKVRQSALKQAYLNKAQNQKQLATSLATQGIRGGASETSQLNIMNQYGTARASADTDYANSANSINQSIDKNKADYRMDMMARAEEYRQNQMNARWQAAREDAANKWNAQREDVVNKWNARREDSLNEYNSRVEYWNNYYTDVYSGYGKNDIAKALRTAEKNIKNAKTPAERMRFQQQKRAILARRGVLVANGDKVPARGSSSSSSSSSRGSSSSTRHNRVRGTRTGGSSSSSRRGRKHHGSSRSRQRSGRERATVR